MSERRLESLLNAKKSKDTIELLNSIEDIEEFLTKLDEQITSRSTKSYFTNNLTRDITGLGFSEHPILDDYLRKSRKSNFKINEYSLSSNGYSGGFHMNTKGITLTVRHGYTNDLKTFIELCIENNPDIEFFKKVLLVLTV